MSNDRLRLAVTAKERATLAKGIGRVTIALVSGGKIHPTDAGIELRIGTTGYRVVVELEGYFGRLPTTYKVSRRLYTCTVNGKPVFSGLGSLSGVDDVDLSEIVFRAGRYQAFPDNAWWEEDVA